MPLLGRLLARGGRRTAPAQALLASAGWPTVVILLVLAGSLSPYSFDLTVLHAQVKWGPAAIGWPASPPHDLAINFLVYLPVGATVCRWIRRCMPWAEAITATFLAGVSLSILAETIQTLIPARTPSWIDVMVNAAGTAVGALAAPAVYAAGRSLAEHIRSSLLRTPLSVVTSGVALAVMLAGLWPYDLVHSTAQLHHSLVRGRWTALAPSQGDDLPGVIGRPVLPTFALAAMFLTYGCLAALAERESGTCRAWAAEHALLHATILSLLVEVMQTFVISRSFDALDATLNAAAAGLGAYFAILVIDAPSQSLWQDRVNASTRAIVRGSDEKR